MSKQKRIPIILIFFINMIVIMLLNIGYEWEFYISSSNINNIDILRKAILIKKHIHDRYLILPKILISYPFSYTLSVVIKECILD